MTNTPKSSAQRSRSPSQSEEVIESQEELLNSEHEEDSEVPFHPCHVQPTSSKSSRTTPHSSRNVHALSLKVHTWIGWLMIIYIIDFSSGTLNAENILECKLAALLECQQCKKGHSLEWQLRHGPICVLEFAFKCKLTLRCYMGEI